MLPTRPTAIVLAAGRGSRLGGPKALLAWPRSGKASGKGAADDVLPLAFAHAEARLAADCGRVVIVVRRIHVPKLLAWVTPGVDLLVSEADDELGPAGSLAAAADKLAPELATDSVVIITPVDAVPASAKTTAMLLERLAADPQLIAAKPVYAGRGGHPIAARAALLEVFRDKKPPILREALGAFASQVAEVDAGDPRVLIDLDTPADVARTLAVPPRFLG